jgi:hypothetical protein
MFRIFFFFSAHLSCRLTVFFGLSKTHTTQGTYTNLDVSSFSKNTAPAKTQINDFIPLQKPLTHMSRHSPTASHHPPDPIEDILEDSVSIRSSSDYEFLDELPDTTPVPGDSDDSDYDLIDSVPNNDFSPTDSEEYEPIRAILDHYGTSSRSGSDNNDGQGNDGGGNYDSDSASNYSQDTDSESNVYINMDSSLHQGRDNAVLPNDVDNQNCAASSSQVEEEEHSSGGTTPSPTSAPTEHLTNVLRHGLQSRNRRRNPMWVPLPSTPEDELPDFELLDGSLAVQMLYAAWTAEEYCRLVGEVWREVYDEDPPEFLRLGFVVEDVGLSS